MTLVIDTREPHVWSQTLGLLIGPSVDKQFQYLESADYMLLDQGGFSLGIERKRLTDLLNSLASGRLESQLERMAADYDHRLLVVEGFFRADPAGKVKFAHRASGWNWASVEMKLWALQSRYGTQLLQVHDQTEFALLLKTLHQQAARGRFHA